MASAITDEKAREYKATVYRKFLTPEERKKRALVAAKSNRGWNSISEIAKALGVNWSTVNNMLTRENASILSMYRLADKLGVTVSYLTDR